MDGWFECFDLCNKWQFRMRHETECCSQTRRGSRQAVEADVLTRVLSCLLITPFHIDNFSSFFFHFSCGIFFFPTFDWNYIYSSLHTHTYMYMYHHHSSEIYIDISTSIDIVNRNVQYFIIQK